MLERQQGYCTYLQDSVVVITSKLTLLQPRCPSASLSQSRLFSSANDQWGGMHTQAGDKAVFKPNICKAARHIKASSIKASCVAPENTYASIQEGISVHIYIIHSGAKHSEAYHFFYNHKCWSCCVQSKDTMAISAKETVGITQNMAAYVQNWGDH